MRPEETLAIERLRRENRALREELRRLAVFRRLAHHDQLTGLYNRRHFELRLGQEVERSARQGSSLALLLADVDDLKLINDRVGHQGGDQALRWVGELLRVEARAVDTVCRIGGDEFAVIMPDTSEEGARALAERIRAAARRSDRRPLGMARTAVGLTLGFFASEGLVYGPEELFCFADTVLCRNKRRAKRIASAGGAASG